jgi:asparagine synthase (glutamine-hydrolysing)
MCGITGIVHSDPGEYVDPDNIDEMCRVIRHRGPDEWGKWVNRHVGIGMTRLRIIDLAKGSQPIHNEDKSVWIVFNGEIYNFKDLRKELEKRGHLFYSDSDTETIVHLYEDLGEDCVHKLRGMFSFAIWDEKAQSLFLARDRLGIKPLHYFEDGKRLIFGSEIKSILKCPNVPRRVNHSALMNYFAYGYVPDPDSMFEGIKKLPPGHLLTLRKGRLSIRQYWDVNFNPDYTHTEEYFIERTLEIMREAVKMRLVSEVPLGAFLSGGVDSSMVVALMAQEMSKPVKTFSIGFENQQFNELPYARMVAQKYGTDHYEEIVKPDSEEVIQALIKQFDEPFADSSAIPTYYVSKMTRKYVTVALSGDGGDELFGGYMRYLDGYPAYLTGWIPLRIRKPIFLKIANSLPEWFPAVNTLRYSAVTDDERYIWKMSKGVSLAHTKIFNPSLRDKVSNSDPSDAFMIHLNHVQKKDKITRRQYLDTKTYLPGDILTKVDRASMLVSLEARVPILDHKLVEFAARIPARIKIKGRERKYLLKKTAEQLLPKNLVYRRKMGFAVPIAEWIKTEWKDMIHELLKSKRALARENFNPNFVTRLLNEHKIGRRNHDILLWTLMVLELWYRQFID